MTSVTILFNPAEYPYNAVNHHSTIAHPALRLTSRGLLLAIILLMTVWMVEIRYPPLSFPAIGLLLLTIITAMAAILPIRMFLVYRESQQPLLRHAALLPGFLFVAWVLLRWSIEGFPASGASDVGTILWAAVYLIIGIHIIPSRECAENNDSPSISFPFLILLFLSVIGLACGLHAIWQYHYAYDQAYQQLLDSLGNRAPDQTQMGLLHHLRLRRVASIWGDPNTLATFSAISVCSSLELLTFDGKIPGVKEPGRLFYFRKRVIRILAIIAIFACLAAIYYSGSRGGVLDGTLVLLGFGGYLWFWGRRRDTSIRTVIVLFVLMTAVWMAPTPTIAQETQTTAASGNSSVPVNKPGATEQGWIWRSNTIRERLYYLQVGEKMIRMAPILGLGPGSVELYFGRLKSPDARETKYLHNWIVQIWAETGLAGLGLLCWFLGGIAWKAWRTRLYTRQMYRALAVIFLLLVIDGLFQVSWNQRELMTLFGLVCGVLISQSAEYKKTNSSRNYIRLTGCIAAILAFATFETRFLSAASNKRIAGDAMYAGNLQTATKYWERASQWTPNDPEPYAARAAISLGNGNLSAAGMLIEKALEANPESASLHAQAAAIFHRLRQDKKSDMHLTKALEFYPSKSEYNFQYAQLLESKSSLTKALQFAQRAQKFNYRNETREQYENYVTHLEKLLHKEPMSQ